MPHVEPGGVEDVDERPRGVVDGERQEEVAPPCVQRPGAAHPLGVQVDVDIFPRLRILLVCILRGFLLLRVHLLLYLQEEWLGLDPFHPERCGFKLGLSLHHDPQRGEPLLRNAFLGHAVLLGYCLPQVGDLP